jgi:hypothetical protein
MQVHGPLSGSAPARAARPAPALRAADARVGAPDGGGVVQARLEGGEVVLLDEPFDLAGADPFRLAPAGESRVKNVSFDPATGVLKGAGEGADAAGLTRLMAAYADWSRALLARRLPGCGHRLTRGKTSFRPRRADQAISPRKDDRRLHVDAFPSQPVQGRRILRLFHNLNPVGEPRVWEVGEPFADHAARFLPRIAGRPRAPGWALQALGLTKGRRSPYDALMLDLHDAAKADDRYQAQAPRRTLTFAPGAVWAVFTDAVPHAALSGRYALEQTFFLPVEAMTDPELAPLRILERMTGRRLA